MSIMEKIKGTCSLMKDIKVNIGASERVLSTFSGGILLTSGIRKITSHPRRSLLALVTGGALIWRGISGYCPAKKYIEKYEEDDPEYKVIEHYYYKK